MPCYQKQITKSISIDILAYALPETLNYSMFLVTWKHDANVYHIEKQIIKSISM